MEQNWKSKIKPHTIGQFIFNKGAKTIQQGKNSFFNKQIVLGQMDIHMQKNEFGSITHTIYKSNKTNNLF